MLLNCNVMFRINTVICHSRLNLQIQEKYVVQRHKPTEIEMTNNGVC